MQMISHSHGSIIKVDFNLKLVFLRIGACINVVYVQKSVYKRIYVSIFEWDLSTADPQNVLKLTVRSEKAKNREILCALCG